MFPRFIQAKPFVTLAVVVAGWLLVPVAVKSLTRATFFEFTAPLPVAASYARDLQEYWSLRLHSNHDLISAGRDLASLNASYQIAVQQNSDLRAQLTRLEALVRLPGQPEFRFEHARVARRDLTGWWQRLVIRKGKNFGLTVGAPVVFAGGVVGRIAEVGAYTAVVDLISSPTVRLAGAIEGDTNPVSYQGGINPTLGPPRGVIEFVPLGIFLDPASPLRLVTSGLGGVFPPGLTLGLVVKLEPSADGLFKTGEVQLDPRLSELTEVTVLVPLNPE